MHGHMWLPNVNRRYRSTCLMLYACMRPDCIQKRTLITSTRYSVRMEWSSRCVISEAIKPVIGSLLVYMKLPSYVGPIRFLSLLGMNGGYGTLFFSSEDSRVMIRIDALLSAPSIDRTQHFQTRFLRMFSQMACPTHMPNWLIGLLWTLRSYIMYRITKGKRERKEKKQLSPQLH